jgi:hypothetical protein
MSASFFEVQMSALGPGRVKTFFLPPNCTQPGAIHVEAIRLSIFLLYRVWSQSERNFGPR